MSHKNCETRYRLSRQHRQPSRKILLFFHLRAKDDPLFGKQGCLCSRFMYNGFQFEIIRNIRFISYLFSDTEISQSSISCTLHRLRNRSGAKPVADPHKAAQKTNDIQHTDLSIKTGFFVSYLLSSFPHLYNIPHGDAFPETGSCICP